MVALKRAGSLGAAARLLGCEQSTASRRLAALEAELGVALVNRAPEGLTLNEAGTLAAELGETIDRGVEDLVRRIGGEDARAEGIVRLATTDSTAAFLMSGLVPLREQYPKIRVELVVGNTPHDLLRREADLALRMYRETSPSLISKKLGDLAWSVFASPKYLETKPVACGATIDAATLVGHPLIGFSAEIARAPGGVWLTANSRPEDIVIRAGSITAMINATKNGIGLAVLPCFAVHGMADVVRVTSAVVAVGEAFLVIPPDHKQTKRVRVVMDAVSALFDRDRELLAGR